MKKIIMIIIVFILISFSQGRSYTNLTAEQVHNRLVNADTLILLDVRETSEYRSGHIAEPEGQLPLTPVLMPMNSNVLEQKFSRLPKDMDIIVYCGSGFRSASASALLDSQGFTRIFNMTGGFSSWPYETRAEGFGDHSGAWVSPTNPEPVAVNCAYEGISSTLTIPPAAIPGGDSVYVELHLTGDLAPQPPGVPQSDLKGLYRVTVLDPFGLSLFRGDSLALNDTVTIDLYPEPNPYSMPPSNEGISVFIPDKGWVPVKHTLDNICFHHTESVLRKWYNLKGFYPTIIAENENADELIMGVYPNPFNGSLTIDAPKNARIIIYDINGRFVSKVKTGTWTPVSTLSSGIYFININFNNQNHIKRVLYIK
ncbi:T9SS type A sorting domain-containing protein [candidate division KSB1 bacterium]|nr:T9SS type A sorting domain-containing protein [candidate division KSB1 bacterium]